MKIINLILVGLIIVFSFPLEALADQYLQQEVFVYYEDSSHFSGASFSAQGETDNNIIEAEIYVEYFRSGDSLQLEPYADTSINLPFSTGFHTISGLDTPSFSLSATYNQSLSTFRLAYVKRVKLADGSYKYYLDPYRPAEPIGITASADSYNKITVHWSANTEPDLAGYKLYRDGVEIADQAGTSYTDTGVTGGNTYTYTVKAYNTRDSLSDASAAATATTPAPPAGQAPAAPTGISANADGPTQVTVSWSANSEADITGYRVYRDGVEIGQISGLQLVDNSAAPETTYTYTVKAVNSAGYLSPASAAATVTTPAAAGGGQQGDSEAPAEPTGLSVDRGNEWNLLYWNSNTEPDLAGYRIYRDGIQVGQIGPGASQFWDTGLEPDTNYYYEVKAYDTAGNVSEPATATFSTVHFVKDVDLYRYLTTPPDLPTPPPAPSFRDYAPPPAPVFSVPAQEDRQLDTIPVPEVATLPQEAFVPAPDALPLVPDPTLPAIDPVPAADPVPAVDPVLTADPVPVADPVLTADPVLPADPPPE